MDNLEKLTQLDYAYIFLGLIIILLAFKFLVTLVEWVLDKTGIETKWMRKKREDHELLIKTSKSLSVLQEKHDKDNEELKKCLKTFIAETKKENDCLRQAIKKQDDDNVSHWDTSKGIRNDINKTLQSLAEANTVKDKQIESLIVAQKELLAEKINEKYKYYVSIEGIPEDEYDEFVSMHKAYNGVGGNHHGDAKFEYCINHLRIIPVETKLIYDHE